MNSYGVGGLLKLLVNESGFEVDNPLLCEPEFGAATFETLSQFTGLLGQLTDPSLQCRVLGHHGLDGFAVPGGRLGVTKLAHEFPDALSLDSDLAVCSLTDGLRRPDTPQAAT
ncbi:hypothetical protein ABT255_02290 [Streptomyces mirabilis]|uniref:hypothetical protein n=1 Tax=Streptomyces mirabilis TaxID=68239 RepID=UPI003316C980